MKLNHRQKYRLLWVGVGLGAVLLVSAMILIGRNDSDWLLLMCFSQSQ